MGLPEYKCSQEGSLALTVAATSKGSLSNRPSLSPTHTTHSLEQALKNMASHQARGGVISPWSLLGREESPPALNSNKHKKKPSANQRQILKRGGGGGSHEDLWQIQERN